MTTQENWRDLEPEVEWYDGDSVALQIDGNDLVQVVEPDEDGWATVYVFESTDPEARVLFQGRVNIRAHEREEG